jgi:hypothetical protein
LDLFSFGIPATLQIASGDTHANKGVDPHTIVLTSVATALPAMERPSRAKEKVNRMVVTVRKKEDTLKRDTDVSSDIKVRQDCLRRNKRKG